MYTTVRRWVEDTRLYLFLVVRGRWSVDSITRGIVLGMVHECMHTGRKAYMVSRVARDYGLSQPPSKTSNSSKRRWSTSQESRTQTRRLLQPSRF